MKKAHLLLIPLSILVPLASQGAQEPSDNAVGEALWRKIVIHKQTGQERSCAICHTQYLQQPGKHAKTGKPIEPMAPSVNPARLTDQAKIEKWFKRNCKWTYDRECTENEKAAFLAYIRSQ